MPGWLCDAGTISGAGEVVLEIGPGTGALTKELLKRGAQVVAVEADPRAIELLKETFASEIISGQLRVEQGDMRELSAENVAKIFDLRDHEYKLIANIPYYLSGLLFRTFLETSIQPSDLVFLVQKEVAERIARDSKESLLSLSVKIFGEPAYIRTVGKGHFTPPPAVDSAIIAIHNLTHSSLSETELALFFKLIHLGFGQRRKQLVGNLSSEFPRETVQKSLEKLGLEPTIRAEDLSIEQWIELTHSLSTLHTD